MPGTAGIYNTAIDQGATWTVNIVYTDYNGDPVNLTGYTARMQLREKFTSDAVLTLTTSNGGLTLTPLTGGIAVIATAAQTEVIPAGFYLYDLELTSGSEITRLIQGQITVRAQVTANV
jgi:hypothetical protein